MATGYYLQDNPNRECAQYGWPRTRVSGVIGVHTTESGVIPSGPDGGAENTAAFIGRRTDPGGYHALADADSRIKMVHPRYAAWADTTNNAHAMSVSGAMNAARWRDLAPARAAAIVRNMGLAAAQLVQDALASGLLAAAPPARRITPQEAISGSRAGFYGHGETNPGRRYDPGQNFDWDLFLATYASAVGGGINYASTTTEEPEVTEDQLNAIVHRVNVFAQQNAIDVSTIVINEVRVHTKFNSDRVLDALKQIPQIDNALVEELKATLAEGAEESIEQIKAKLQGLSVTLTADGGVK